MNQIIDDFNDTLLSLSLSVANVCPKSIIGQNIKDIERRIKNKINYTKFIDIFCIKILMKYEKQIMNGEESFFMEKNYDDDLDDDSYFDYIEPIKSIWNELADKNKNTIKQYMKILCQLSQQYYILTSNQIGLIH